MTDKPHAPACERNREPILEVLRWQTSDRIGNHAGIRAWLDEAGLPNTPPPLALDVNHDAWPEKHYDAAFSANTLHIMGWAEVERLFAGLGGVLTDDAKLVIYGPFHYGGRPTSDSNARFDAALRAQITHMGIRDFEAVDRLARGIGLQLVEDRAMPANNRCLVWRRV